MSLSKGQMSSIHRDENVDGESFSVSKTAKSTKWWRLEDRFQGLQAG